VEAEGASASFTSVGGQAGFRVIGGASFRLHQSAGGASHTGAANGDSALTRLGLGGAVSATCRPGIEHRPYLAVNNRWYKFSA